MERPGKRVSNGSLDMLAFSRVGRANVLSVRRVCRMA